MRARSLRRGEPDLHGGCKPSPVGAVQGLSGRLQTEGTGHHSTSVATCRHSQSQKHHRLWQLSNHRTRKTMSPRLGRRAPPNLHPSYPPLVLSEASSECWLEDCLASPSSSKELPRERQAL